MILINNLRLELGEEILALKKRIAAKMRVPAEDIRRIKLIRKSLDARKKDDIHFTCSVAVALRGSEDKAIVRRKQKDVSAYDPPKYLLSIARKDITRPVVVGFGPAGMFAALVLAYSGACPIVIERGCEAEKRRTAVEAFRAGGALDPECNVQFGEGGAGTFSDGKLNTGINDPRVTWVLQEFAAHGAPKSILTDAKPHIGTDILVDVVQNIRREIISRGGEVRFESTLKRLKLDNDRVCGAVISCGGEEYELNCENLILAPGHSARDTFETLLAQGVPMEPKPFSMGVRIEHRQRDIDLSQYGREAGDTLPPADYSLNTRFPDGESAYTFCMCPGGQVIAAASEEGGVVTNGMSNSKRDGENANAALLVTLLPGDFPGEGVLSGMYWQREIEHAAYDYGGHNYLAPAQLVGDFLTGKKSDGPGNVQPSYHPGVVWGDIHQILPQKICGVLERALPELGKKLQGFDSPDAVLTAPETRSSSPVRIPRGGDMQSAISGLYPCGEGAGYAGGISSAAVDGMRCAEAVMKTLACDELPF